MIYAVDRELVYPKRLDAIIPTWLNHVMVSDHMPHPPPPVLRPCDIFRKVLHIRKLYLSIHVYE